MPKHLYLTFDVEDTLNCSAIQALEKTLECLKKEKLRGIFFITGGIAEKLKEFDSIVSLLHDHEIGYHSSGHSIRPIIPEYTDLENFQEAVDVSLKRETAHINALTGAPEGKGGLFALRELFPDKRISSFRAPGFSWSPPHLTALKRLKIKYDFSANISSRKLSFKEITFFPFPLEIMPPEGNELTFSFYRRLLWQIISNQTTVIVMHPHSLLNAEPWDAMYWHNNPSRLVKCSRKNVEEISKNISDLRAFLRLIKNLQKIGIITVSPPLTPAHPVNVTSEMVQNSYVCACYWPLHFFNYQPKFMYQHFEDFFDC